MTRIAKIAMGSGWVVAIFLIGYLWAQGEAGSEPQKEITDPAIGKIPIAEASGDTGTISNEVGAEIALSEAASSAILFGQGYSDFPAKSFSGRSAPLRLTKEQRNYQTRLVEAYLQPINFGGSLVLTQFGCGTGCTFAYALDKSSGFTLDFPLGGEEYQAMQLHALSDSDLVWVSWYTDASWEKCIAQAWRLGPNGFVEVSKVLSVNCNARGQLAAI